MFRLLGVIAGGISLAILAWKGFDASFGPFLSRVLEELERAYAYFFGFAEPLIRQALAYLKATFGWDLDLHRHWKHIFVLMGLYFGATRQKLWDEGHKSFSLFTFLEGGVIALFASVGTGTAALDSIAVAIYPALGILVFDLLGSSHAAAAGLYRNENETASEQLRRMFGFDLVRALIAAIILLTVTLLAPNAPNLGLLGFGAYVIFLAAYWHAQGDYRISGIMFATIAVPVVLALLGMADM